MLVEDVEEHNGSDDCDVQLEGVEDKVSDPVRCQSHTCDNLNVLQLSDTFNHKVTDCHCNDDRVGDSGKEDNRAGITSGGSSSQLVSRRVGRRSRLELKLRVSCRNLQDGLVHVL